MTLPRGVLRPSASFVCSLADGLAFPAGVGVWARAAEAARPSVINNAAHKRPGGAAFTGIPRSALPIACPRGRATAVAFAGAGHEMPERIQHTGPAYASSHGIRHREAARRVQPLPVKNDTTSDDCGVRIGHG